MYTQLVHVLVVGGTRFIGPHVARSLVQLGHAVTVYHRGQTEAVLPEYIRHVHAPQAARPVREFPPILFDPAPGILIHMISMCREDTLAAIEAFQGRIRRAVWLSSGDIYRAYGRFMGFEDAPVEEGPLTEDSPLRTVLHPYRSKAKSIEDLEYYYEKILVEREALGARTMPGVVLRLPKVYGPGDDADFSTVHRYRQYPQWRWTHGYVENVAAAIVLAALHPAAAHRTYNVREEYTPTVGERLTHLPPSPLDADTNSSFRFDQNIVYSTNRIRIELGYNEPIPYEEGLRRTLASSQR